MRIFTGQTFGRLTVIERSSDRRTSYICRCSCGTMKVIRADHLTSGASQSCGCLHREKASARAGVMHKAKTTHGMSKTRTYGIWCAMRERCSNTNHKHYKEYGERGIRVCDRWQTFEAFLADMGKAPKNHTIERIDNDGNYTPENCRWATRLEQMNNRRCNRRVTVDGVTMTVSQWSRATGLHYNTIRERLEKGYAPEDAISERSLRRKTHCKRGHPLTPDNVYIMGGSRACKTCVKSSARERTKRRQ